MAYIGFGSTSEASSFKLIDNISSQFNGAKVEFNLTSSGTPVTVHSIGMTFIIINGLIMEPNVDYYLGSNFNTIQFTNAPTNGSSFQGRVIETTGVTLPDRSVTKEKLSQDLFKPSVQKITVENNNTSNTFTLDEIVDRPEDISVYADGLYQRANTHYVIPTGSTIQFDTAPVGNTEIDIVYNTISTTVNRTEKSSSLEDFTSPNITVSDKLTSGRISVGSISVTDTNGYDGVDIASGNITCQTLDGTISASATIADGVTYANKPIIVYVGWNSAHNTTSSSRQNYPLDLDLVSVNTTYMTKSTNTFTVVKAGTYQVNVNTMAQSDYNEYAHHRMLKNGSHFFQTHSYGSSSGDKWTDHSYSLIVPNLVVNDTLSFDAYKNGGSYLWHGTASYSQLNITFLHT